MTASRAMAVIQDNGEEVLVALPTEQELLDRIHEISRDADAEIQKWKIRHASLGKGLVWSCLLNMALVLWVVLR